MPIDSFIDANGVRLHLQDWGGAGRPILLVHGLASNARIWNFVAPRLAASFHTAALDQRSHGLSGEAPDGDYGFEAVCSDLCEVSARLGVERPIVVGHSWGAAVALEYAARYPGAAAGVVAIDGGFAGMGKRMTWEETQERLAPPRLAGTPLAAFRDRAKSFMGDLYSEAAFEIVLGNFEVHPDGTIAPHLKFENHMKIVRAMWEQDPEQLYPRVQCPALFLACVPPLPHDPATAQFLAWRREGAAGVQGLMPQAQVEWLEDSIHDVPLQKPDLVAGRIRDFAAAL